MAVEWNTEQILRKVEMGVMRAIVSGTEGVRQEAIRLMQSTPKTGRIYRRRGVEHQASAPGEAPAVDTGTHIGRIETMYDHEGLAGIVAFRAKHAAYLEFGTSRMAPRPYARPALANLRDDIIRDIHREIDRALSS